MPTPNKIKTIDFCFSGGCYLVLVSNDYLTDIAHS